MAKQNKKQPVNKKAAKTPSKNSPDRLKEKAAPKKVIPVKYVNPVKKIKVVRKEINELRSPVYAFNRKIKNAKNNYQARKLKKERKEYLSQVEAKINNLVSTRSQLKTDTKFYGQRKEEKKLHQNKLASIRRKIKKADESKDYKTLEKLSWEELKELSAIDKINGLLGAVQSIQNISEYKREDQEGGAKWILDAASPYSIFEAKAQLNRDIDSGEFRYIYLDGDKYDGRKDLALMMAASADFWLLQRKSYQGTPYFNRFLKNNKTSIDLKWEIAYT